MKFSPLILDRHAFASNVSSFDTAWRTFGWTPAIQDRAGSLEEAVPWATAAARADQPARLRGRAQDVLDPANFDRLHFAFLPLDGRLGFSVCGATERVRGAPEWRVLTHTLLFDHDAFDRLAGFPFALLRDSDHDAWFRAMIERVSFDEPALLEPVVVPASAASRAHFERARLREIARLRDLLIARYGGADRLQSRLAQMYEWIAATQASGTTRRVALRSDAGNAEALLARLAWISLPVAERAAIFFSTEQRKMESPPATLFVLSEVEWGRFIPEATQVIDAAGTWPDREISPGRAYWAATVAHDVALHGRLSAAAERRGWRLIARDDVARLEALLEWRNGGRDALDYDAARELIAIETHAANGSPRVRVRALGHVVARATQASSEDPGVRAMRALELLHLLPSTARIAAVRAAVRTLARGSDADRQSGGFLRLAAAQAIGSTHTVELLRLLDVESALVPPLLRHSEGPLALFHAGRSLARAGHMAGEHLAELAVPQLHDSRIAITEALNAHTPVDARVRRWLAAVLRIVLQHSGATPEIVARVIDDWNPAWLLGEEILRRLTAALWEAANDQQVRPASAQQSARLLAMILALNGDGLSSAQVESILRLSWLESMHGHGPSALERHVADYPHAAVPVLVQLLVSSPPLPLFLRIRRLLLRLPQSHLAGRPELERWRAALAESCPALHARMPRERRNGDQLAQLR